MYVDVRWLGIGCVLQKLIWKITYIFYFIAQIFLCSIKERTLYQNLLMPHHPSRHSKLGHIILKNGYCEGASVPDTFEIYWNEGVLIRKPSCTL